MSSFHKKKNNWFYGFEIEITYFNKYKENLVILQLIGIIVIKSKETSIRD